MGGSCDDVGVGGAGFDRVGGVLILQRWAPIVTAGLGPDAVANSMMLDELSSLTQMVNGDRYLVYLRSKMAVLQMAKRLEQK